MALEKIQVVDQIEVVGEYAVQVRQSTKVMDDGVQIGSDYYHRHVVHPDRDWSNEDAKVKKICDALFDADCKGICKCGIHFLDFEITSIISVLIKLGSIDEILYLFNFVIFSISSKRE